MEEGEEDLEKDQDKQIQTLQIVITCFSFLSILCSLAILITFIRDTQRKKNTNSSLLYLFALSTLLLSICMTISGLGSELLQENEKFCSCQGFLLIFSQNCAIWTLFSLSSSHAAIIWNRGELSSFMILFFSFALSLTFSLPALLAQKIQFETLWCTISNQEPLFVFLSLDGSLLLVCGSVFVVTTLNVVILLSSLRNERRSLIRSSITAPPSPRNSSRKNEIDYHAILNTPNSQISNYYGIKRNLFFNRLGFHALFLSVFLVIIGARFDIFWKGYTFTTWVLLTIPLSLLGFFLFLFILIFEGRTFFSRNIENNPPSLFVQ